MLSQSGYVVAGSAMALHDSVACWRRKLSSSCEFVSHLCVYYLRDVGSAMSPGCGTPLLMEVQT